MDSFVDKESRLAEKGLAGQLAQHRPDMSPRIKSPGSTKPTCYALPEVFSFPLRPYDRRESRIGFPQQMVVKA